MKKTFTLFAAVLLTATVWAQTPQSFKYQAVARDASGDVVADQAVGMQISILQGSTSGTAVYVETFTPNTNEFGLINLNIGAGTVVSGDFTTIDWSADTYFIKTEMDMTGGTTFEEYGTSQLLSVPYALHAKTATNTFSGNYSDLSGAPINVSTFTNDAGYLTSISETDPLFTAWDKTTGISITESQITDLDHFTTTDETDPIFVAHPSNGITSGNITNWTTAFGWGDHSTPGYITDGNTGWDNSYGFTTASSSETLTNKSGNISMWTNDAGYLTDYTETDPVFSNLFSFTSPSDNQLLKYNLGTSKWENWTANFLTTEVDGDITNEIQNLSEVLAEDNSANAQIKNVTDPTDAQDAATKAYIDHKIDLLSIANQGVKDYDGNDYNALLIGNQIWMADNLKTTKYNDATDIPLVTDNTAWSNLTTGAYCWYDNDEATYGDTYGALYNWYTVNTGNLCPTGWHVPTDAEWTTLIDYLGGISVAGGKLKETGTIHWNSPNTVATNESGFTALPGGYRYDDGAFNYVGLNGYWWSSTESFGANAWARYLHYNSANVPKSSSIKKYGFSIRCVRD